MPGRAVGMRRASVPALPVWSNPVRRWRMHVTDGPTLRALLVRIRAGDQQAATALVRRYEPALRRAVRLRLRDRQLRRFLDSSDICQAVLLRFFARVAAGQYELDT